MQKQETDVARLTRQIAELGFWCFRPDIASNAALDEAAGSALHSAREDLAGLPADSITDASLKMGVLCRHLRDMLNPSDDRSLWAHRLAEGLHDDLEGLAFYHASIQACRNPLVEYAA